MKKALWYNACYLQLAVRHLRHIKHYVYVKLKRGQPFVDSVGRGSVSEKNLVLFE